MKKKSLFIMSLLVCALSLFAENVYADDFTTSYIECGGMSFPEPFQPIIRTVILVLQIVAPIGIIIMGSIDFLKAVIASDADKMKKSQKKFVTRLIAGAIVFFVFVIIRFVVDLLADSSNSTDFSTCLNCLINDQDCGAVTTSPFFPDE